MSIDWEAWQFLLGEWEGGNKEEHRQGSGRFSFSFDLDENILVRRSRTIFPPTQARQGHTHDDLLIIYAEVGGAKRAIYFDNEEHTIYYEVSLSDDQNQIILESAPVPSLPQFRFTYIKTGVDTLDARFEMTPPGVPGAFFVYLEGSSRRIGPK
jgi:hypothetical protein